MRKHRVITKAPSIRFRDVHPTPSAGRVFKGEDLPPDGGVTGRESDYICCKQCGYIFDKTKHPRGDGWGGNESAETISGANAKDPVVTGGCPLCGSSEYE